MHAMKPVHHEGCQPGPLWHISSPRPGNATIRPGFRECMLDKGRSRWQ